MKSSAYEWNSYIINYSKSDYGNGAQTWQISSYNQSWTYFANQKGLLQFDGHSWEQFKIHNHLDVRSVYASKKSKRIYVGGINEFGYYEPQENGILKYVCLSDSLNKDSLHIANVWSVHENDNIIYFQGDYSVLKYVNGKFTSLEMNAKIDCSDMVNGVLYLGTSKGIWILVGNTFFPLNAANSLNKSRIRNILPYKKGVLIVTAYDGLYYCDGKTTVPFYLGIEEFLRRNEVFCAAISNNKVALGTIHYGVVIVDLKTNHVSYYNTNNGLQNQTVLSLHFDMLGNLWTGLDQGIDYICLNLPFTSLYTQSSSLGTGYTALENNGLLYLGTNRGLYVVNTHLKSDEYDLNAEFIPHSSGQIWKLSRVSHNIFCSHDRGLFLLKDKKLKRVGDLQGVWNCLPIMGNDKEAFVGTYEGLYVIRKENDNWKIRCRVKGISGSCRYLKQEADNIIWLVNGEQLIRYHLSKDLTKVLDSRIFTNKDGLPIGEYGISKIKGKIYFLTSNGIYKYNKESNKMIEADEINRLLDGLKYYKMLFIHNKHLIALTDNELCVNSLDSSKRREIVSIESPIIELINYNESMCFLDETHFIIPNEYGFALVNLSKIQHNTDKNYGIYISKVYMTIPQDSLLYKNNFKDTQELSHIAYKYNSLRFEFSSCTLMNKENVLYQCRLNGRQWSSPTNITSKEYDSLHEGEYKFEVKAIFPDGTVLNDSYPFVIEAPWYRTTAAYIIYIVLILLFFWIMYHLEVLRMKKHESLAVVEKDKELHKIKKEYKEDRERKDAQISQMEKERLEYQLKHKNQELTNSMINLTRRNELLEDIKGDVMKLIHEIQAKRTKDLKPMLLVVKNKIDKNIRDDALLDKVEEQFDLLHNNFMTHLRKKYPKLSQNDLMMCAYLKMGLSTKEIAELLNISIRGVETQRYRLRKTFKLSHEESLTSFIDNSF